MIELIRRLKSDNSAERTEAAYEVTRHIIERNPQIVDILRENLKSQDEELLEISIMRLGLRATDVHSLDDIINISKNSCNSLILSACVFAMLSIADTYPDTRERVRARLKSMMDGNLEDELRNTILAELAKI